MSSDEVFIMQFNAVLLEAARKLVLTPNLSMPAEIPGFPGIFAASTTDHTIDTIGAFVSEDGISYKIGTPHSAK